MEIIEITELNAKREKKKLPYGFLWSSMKIFRSYRQIQSVCACFFFAAHLLSRHFRFRFFFFGYKY